MHGPNYDWKNDLGRHSERLPITGLKESTNIRQCVIFAFHHITLHTYFAKELWNRLPSLKTPSATIQEQPAYQRWYKIRNTER